MSKDVLSFTIVGGCFPIQDNILPEKLYHAHISRKVQSKFNHYLNIEIIRYERFSDCLDKIKHHNEIKPADVLLFHFRSEHFLRLCKFIFRYKNEYRVVTNTFNLLFCNRSKVEDFDYLSSAGHPVRSRKSKQNKFYSILVATNYLLGFLVGNAHFALKRYEKLAAEIIEFCEANEIKLLLAGPASRPHTWWENYLTNKIDQHMRQAFDTTRTAYVELLGTRGKDEQPLFFNNGIQVNEAGHRRIAELILNRMDFLNEF